MTFAVFQGEQYPKLYGGAAEFWKYHGREIILHGPYETGKTFAVLTKLHALLCKYPKARGLMTRETYADLVNTAVVTYEKKVLTFPPEDVRSGISKFGGEKPQFYDYPNGARLVVAGLDNPGKTLSAEYDFIYVNQAEELDLNTWETLTRAVTGRAGNAPYTQMMGDCNPGSPHHWILNRSQDRKLKLLQQLHEHNPTLFDQQTGQMTEQGKRTMETLDALTGIRYQRGRLGLWVQAEGIIYDNFSPDLNVSEQADYNPDWKTVAWGGDDGYAAGQGPGTEGYHPRVILLAQYTPQGGVNIFAEYVKTNELSERTLDNVLALPYPAPEIAHIDSSAAELRARLWERGIYTIGATHKVSEGIKNVRRLICDGNGMRLLKIHPRCKETIREFLSYRYNPNFTGVQVGEPAPLKMDDHCMDSVRYLCWPLRYAN